jgi:hypothetical protein
MLTTWGGTNVMIHVATLSQMQTTHLLPNVVGQDKSLASNGSLILEFDDPVDMW